MGTTGWVVAVFAVLSATAGPVAGAGSLDAASDPAERAFDALRESPGALVETRVRSARAPAASARAATALAQQPPENNTTIAHRDPEDLGDEVAPSALESWLAREMSGSGGIDLSDEDRERARELVESDPELADLAARYATGDADPQADGSDVLGAAQRQFFADVQRYRDALDEYERAGAANRTDRERRLAHRLERRAAAVNRSARLLTGSDAELGATDRDAGANLTRTVERVRANVTASQMAVRERTLVRTRLAVAASDSVGSFADPVALSGRLRTAGGDPVANETVTLAVGRQVRDVTTDAAGRFAFDYRPTFDAAGERDRTVWFLPANDSAYHRASAAATFAVEPTTPTVTLANHTESVAYGESVAVAGSVAAGGEDVPNVPVAVSAGGVRLATVATGSNGAFYASARLPANVSAGDRRVRVRLAVGDSNRATGANGSGAGLGAPGASRLGETPWGGLLVAESDASDGPPALAPANASGRVTVESTATDLSIARVDPLEASAFVTGRLVTSDGAPVANQTVALRADGAPAASVTTNDTGGFAATVGLAANATDDSRVRVTAQFGAPGNLDPARANATVSRSGSEPDLPVDPLELGAAGVLGMAAVGVAVWRFRSGGAEPFEQDGSDGEAGDGRDSGESGRDSSATLLDAATSALDEGAYDAAVGAAYASARRRLAGEAGVDRPAGARTHWEFYADCRAADLPDDRLDELESLTATYERAAFAPESVSAEEASEAVELARSLA